jgi:hypothetical protein
MEDKQAYITTEQPVPIKNNNPPIWDFVIEDMKRRDNLGIKRYGTTLQAFNGRDTLIDLYEELLDACVYCRQLIYERESKINEG